VNFQIFVDRLPNEMLEKRARLESTSARTARSSKYATPSVASMSRSVKRSVLGRTKGFPAISPVTIHSINRRPGAAAHLSRCNARPLSIRWELNMFRVIALTHCHFGKAHTSPSSLADA
jgi:hypothetical protein